MGNRVPAGKPGSSSVGQTPVKRPDALSRKPELSANRGGLQSRRFAEAVVPDRPTKRVGPCIYVTRRYENHTGELLNHFTGSRQIRGNNWNADG